MQINLSGAQDTDYVNVPVVPSPTPPVTPRITPANPLILSLDGGTQVPLLGSGQDVVAQSGVFSDFHGDV